MLTLTSDFESDSFLSQMSTNGQNDDHQSVEENLRRNLNLQGNTLNQLSANNRELSNVQSQLARLRSELENSEMLRQTLEYELTLLRTQHGKQNAFIQQLQKQFQQSEQQIEQLQTQIKFNNEQKDNLIKEKDQRIKQLEKEAENSHDRERRIEALNEQIFKMEKTFSDSESLSRQHLAQSILTKERETELKREFQLIQIKLQYSEQALEQERVISNEGKLNVQLLTNRLADFERNCEQLKNTSINEQRKIDELQRQCSNEKLLRSTLTKLQSELETKSDYTQKLTIDYEKQLKQIREELANYRRKYRNNEDKYSQILNKTFELLRLTKIINETIPTDQILPSLKQLEELKFHFEQLKITKVDQTNEINRLKKTIERLNRTTNNQKQVEHQTEITRDKLQIQFDELQEKTFTYEETFLRLKRERENFIQEIEKKNCRINSIHSKLKNLLGKSTSNLENDLIEFEEQWKTIHFKCKSLEEKLIERDNGTLILTQKLEEQVLHLKEDFQGKYQKFLKEKQDFLIRHENDIQHLTLQFNQMEIRAKDAEYRLNNENQSKNQFIDQSQKFHLLFKHFIAILIPLRKRYFQLIYSNQFLKFQFNKFNQMKQILYSNYKKKSSFRVFVISIIALKRFFSFKNNSSLINIPSTNFIYDQQILSSNHFNFIQTINSNDIFQSFITQLNHLYPALIKGSLIKLLARGIPKSSSNDQTIDHFHSFILRLQQTELLIVQKENQSNDLRKAMKNIQTEIQSRVDYQQFQRVCEELQRALDREKQAQDLLNEQNNQLKSLTDILHQTQKEKDFLQQKFTQITQNDKHSKDKIYQLTQTHQQMDENIKRAEKAIRLVVSDKEQISAFCTRINSALNVSERRGVENFEQLISQLDALVQLPLNFDQKKSPPEMILCQTMARGFVSLLDRLKESIVSNNKDIQSLKEHCQILTEQFRQLSTEDISQVDSSQTVLLQAHPIRVQVNHHPQSAFKPIKPEEEEEKD